MTGWACGGGEREPTPGGNRPRQDAGFVRLDGADGEDATPGAPDATGMADATGPFDGGRPDRGVLDAEPTPDATSPDAETGQDARADAGVLDSGFRDAGAGADATSNPDGALPVDGGIGPSLGSQQIAAVRSAADGPVGGLSVDDVIVTYVKPLVGTERAGFVVQADPIGPALFVAIDPATLTPPPARGDRVRFTVLEKGTHFGGIKEARQIGAWARVGTGTPLAPLVQDLSTRGDIVSAVDGYELELIDLAGTIASGFGFAGGGHVSARVDSAGTAGNTGLELRIPAALYSSMGIGNGCVFRLSSTPLWRFNATAQPSAWAAQELQIQSCPAPRILSAAPRNDTRITISADRLLDPASVTGGAQFTFSGGLSAMGATVVGSLIVLDTTRQSSGAQYSVTVGPSVRDLRGASIDPSYASASFTGTGPVADVRINELNANITGACDLVELRVLEDGSLDGWTLNSRITNMVTFSGLTVRRNDIIVVHANSASPTCNPGASANETSFQSEMPRASYTANYDTAWDWYSTIQNIASTDAAIILRDARGNIVDALLASDDPTGTAASDSEQAAGQAAAVGEWRTPSGTIPPGGYIDDDFNAAAVQDLNATDTTPLGRSIQRTGNGDTNTALDFTDQNAATFGSINPGQTNL